jgi:hypothetical protein
VKNFDELLGDLEKLQKSEPHVDPEPAADPIAAAADPAADPVVDPATDPAAADPADNLKKSLTLDDGTEIEIEDATKLVKSLQDAVKTLHGEIDSQSEAFGKVLQVQTDLVKSLHADIQALRSEGSGRKSVVLSMVDKQPAVVTKPETLSREQVMAKCMEAQNAGRLTALDVSVAESSLNRGLNVPERIIAAIG